MIVYVLGSGHCGSTLLNLLLNGHSFVLGLSELIRLGKTSTGATEPFKDGFWAEVDRCFRAREGYSLHRVDLSVPRWRELTRWDQNQLEEFGRVNNAIYDCVFKNSDARVLVDASKFPHRLYQLLQTADKPIYVLHLVRDGRAVVNSYQNKYGSFWAGFRRWLSPSLLAFRLRGLLPEERWFQLRYEHLAREPESSLREVCAWLGIDFEEKMLRYRSHPYVGVGGNRMLENEGEEIELDEQWKHELSVVHRFTFDLLGGWLNKMYGYSWTTKD